MALPAPHLDDRRFQDLVDDAKRLVMRRCPEWTDHNVSDPGVTLIETFAFITDTLLYRLNRVPDRLYVKFLDLIGLQLLVPTAATAPVTFWLSARTGTQVLIPAGTSVGTVRTETEESVVFTTLRDLPLVPCQVLAVRTRAAGSPDSTDRTGHAQTGTAFPAFSPVPTEDDELLIGLSEPVPGCVVSLDFACTIKGVGVDPRQPPVRWEARTSNGWAVCEVERDETGGLNRSGSVVLHVPPGHQASVVDTVRAGWLRARVVDFADGRPVYRASPVVSAAAAGTIGGTVDAAHAELVEDDALGRSEGVPGQTFTASRAPVLDGLVPPRLQVAGPDGWTDWTRVDDFSASGPRDRHYLLDGSTGEISFGPAVRRPDGSLRQHGAVPEIDGAIRLASYATGGGRRGNVGAGTIRSLRSSIPFVAEVTNRRAAQGGVDGETLDEAKVRGPLLLRTRSRAVTAEDYEAITREVAPELARVRCLTAGEEDVHAGSVRVLVVPAAAGDSRGRLSLESLVPREDTLRRVSERIDQVRLVGTRVAVEPPRYRGVTVVATLVAEPSADPTAVREAAEAALYAFLNPLTGGPDGSGWPFGRDVLAGDVYAVLQRLPQVDLISEARLFSANPVTGERGPETSRLNVEPNSLLFSYEHHIRVEV